MFKTYMNASAGVSGPSGMQPVSSPSSGGSGPGGWQPSTLYLLGLLVLEVLAVGFISKHL